MRSALVAAFLTLGIASFGSAQAAECVGTGYRSTFGADGSAFFETKSGEACQFAFHLEGAVQNSKIITHPKNGTARMLNLTSFEYRPKPGYKGADSFAIEATGRNLTGSGKSVLTMNVEVN